MAGIPHDASDNNNMSDINEDHEVIVDELLCFLSNKIDVLPPQTIADLCATSFDDAEIENSKKRLFDLCADENSSRFRRRQGLKKSAVNIDDMLRLLQEKGSDVPVFVARDLSRLPPITFDSVDVSSLLHSIRRAQLEIDQLKACVGGQRDATVDLTDVVKAVDRRLSAVETDRAVVSAMPVVVTPPVAVGVADMDKLDAAITCAVDPTPLDGSQWPILAASSVSTSSASSRQLVDVPKWTTVVRRSPAKQVKPIIQPVAVQPTTRTRKTKGVTGSGQGSGLRSVKRKRLASVFATRFEPQVTCDDIVVYLNSHLSPKLPVKVASLETKHNSYASFHITCECDDPSVFMDPFLWPEDIFVRWWRSPRSPVLSLGDSPSVSSSPVTSRRASISEATCLV